MYIFMKFYIHFLQLYSFDAILYCISGLNSLSLQHENNLQLNAIGIYTYSPADPEYFITVPTFDKVKINICGTTVTIKRKGKGKKIKRILCGNNVIEGWFVDHDSLCKNKSLTVETY